MFPKVKVLERLFIILESSVKETAYRLIAYILVALEFWYVETVLQVEQSWIEFHTLQFSCWFCVKKYYVVVEIFLSNDIQVAAPAKTIRIKLNGCN